MVKKNTGSVFVTLALLTIALLTLAAPEALAAPAGKFLSTQDIVAQFVNKPIPRRQRTPASSSPLFNVVHNDIDLRKFDSPVVSQFGGTCSDFATSAAMENVMRQRGIQKLVSHHDLWADYEVYDVDDAVQAATENYITDLQYWTDDNVQSADYQSHRSMKIAQSVPHQYDLQGAISALDQGHPVVMAIQVPSDLDNCSVTIDPNSKWTKGNHVMEAAGYHIDATVSGGGYFIMKNSWGTDCGDNGYHYYPFSLCQRSDLYCYFIEVDSVQTLSN